VILPESGGGRVLRRPLRPRDRLLNQPIRSIAATAFASSSSA
jgi:hypothetical protein